MWQWLNKFKVSEIQLVTDELHEARLYLLAAQSQKENSESLITMYEKRIHRLSNHLVKLTEGNKDANSKS